LVTPQVKRNQLTPIMKATAGILRLSASDLSNHLACNHLTTLDLAVATGSLALPK